MVRRCHNYPYDSHILGDVIERTTDQLYGCPGLCRQGGIAATTRKIPVAWLASAERALRGAAVGRKNWTFAGSDAGGHRAAAVYTLIETCKISDVDPQAGLADVLTRLPDLTHSPGPPLPLRDSRQLIAPAWAGCVLSKCIPNPIPHGSIRSVAPASPCRSRNCR
jgi:hypothetical protein